MSDEAPYYRIHIFCCVNERPADHPRGCCAGRGGAELRAYMKSRGKELGLRDIRVNSAGCLNRCELGPVMVVYPEGVWYGPRTEADIDEILVRHIQGGEVVERLRLKNNDRPPKA